MRALKPARLRREEARKRLAKSVGKWYKEALLSVGILIGWGALTLAVLSVTPDSWYRFVEWASLGLLMWAAVGYGYIVRLFWAGLYVLSQDDDDARDK